ncbi:MAG: TIGR03663 family protein, partial [Roseiflexaceae bacterium]|nr:TIGR03663 family protein [Roseiflexaceae bacterium]
ANPMQYTPGPIFGLSPLPTADNAYGLCVRHQPDNSFAAYFVKLGQFFGHPAVLLAIGALSLGLGVTAALIWRVKGRNGLTPWQRARSIGDPAVEVFASLRTDRRLWVALGIFFIIYAFFFSAFLTNPVGIVSGMFGSVLYWLAQHDVQRGGQPAYYYTMLLTVYEPLALLWGVVGVAMTGWLAARALRQREAAIIRDPSVINWRVALPAMLVWWSAATLFIYSWAGEKMPWLTMHVALPLVLLAAWALANTLGWAFRAAPPQRSVDEEGSTFLIHESEAVDRGLPRALAIYLAIIGGLAVLTLMLIAMSTGSDTTLGTGAPVGLIGPSLLLLLAAATVCYGLLRSFREAVGALALATILVGGAYTLRSSYQINYLWGDTPREMLIFVQSTPDVSRVLERLELASIKRTGGMDMAIWYDNETIWSWYTRNFTVKTQQQPALTAAPGPEVQAVLMLQENIDNYPQNLDLLDGFVVQRLPMRWWFPEDQYRLPQDWLSAEVSPSSPLLMRALR